jgi:uncharacterized membrane protein YbaN (DUF454 family)
MKTKLNRLFKSIFGWGLVFLGVIGLLIPVLPGTLLIFLGFGLLSAHFERVRNKFGTFTQLDQFLDRYSYRNLQRGGRL